jgi:hypothetical protein
MTKPNAKKTVAIPECIRGCVGSLDDACGAPVLCNYKPRIQAAIRNLLGYSEFGFGIPQSLWTCNNGNETDINELVQV